MASWYRGDHSFADESLPRVLPKYAEAMAEATFTKIATTHLCAIYRFVQNDIYISVQDRKHWPARCHGIGETIPSLLPRVLPNVIPFRRSIIIVFVVQL